MNRRLPLDIAPDLTLSIGSESVRVTPFLGMRLAESLMTVSARERVRQAEEEQRVKMARIPIPRRSNRA